MSNYETIVFIAPLGFKFKVVKSRSTYSIALFNDNNKRIEFTGRQFGPSVVDAINRAVYKNDTEEATSAIWFNFGRIDGYVDGPGIIDLWRNSSLA